MPDDVNHRLTAPLALVEEIGFLGNAPDVRHAERHDVRRHRIVRLPVVVERVPNSSACRQGRRLVSRRAV